MFTDMITFERFGSLATYRIDNKKQKQEKKNGTCRNAIFFYKLQFFCDEINETVQTISA